MITIGEPGDPTNDATKPWPTSRRTVDAGTITISAVQTEEPGNARDINFDPLVLPDGITASDDPLPAARSAVYARSFTRRATGAQVAQRGQRRPGALMTDETPPAPARFALPSRILHWLMAPMVIAQLFIGVTMIASLTYYPLLLAIHRPLGITDPDLRGDTPGESTHP